MLRLSLKHATSTACVNKQCILIQYQSAVKCTLNTDVIDQITDNLGTSVQPNWLAEDVVSSSSSSSVMTASQDVLYHN